MLMRTRTAATTMDRRLGRSTMGQLLDCLLIIVTFLQVTKGNNDGSDVWQPTTGTRQEWMKCHGFPCSDWERTKAKLVQLKILAFLEHPRHSTGDQPASDTTELGEDSLDGCIWLTEQQIDETIERITNEQTDKLDGNTVGSRRRRRAKRPKRKITDRAFSLWKMPVVWKFDGDHSAQEMTVIRGGFQHWMDNTCVRFREIGPAESYDDYHILVTKASTGCHSYVGKINRSPQQLNLQSVCVGVFGTIAHEIGHALGLWHEQQRSDRDGSISVQWDNIGPYSGQFVQQDTLSYGVPYDPGSVMHYSQYDGTKNQMRTMLTHDPTQQSSMGQRTGISYADARIINRAYCQDSCSTPLDQPCQYGGYQDPLNCRQCRCPDGTGGTYCQDVAPSTEGCGGLIYTQQSSSSPILISSPGYSSSGLGSYDNHIECNWKVVAGADESISLRFREKFAVYCHYFRQCYHWVEVKHTTRQLTEGIQGSRFCCYDTPVDILVSEGNEIIITLRTNWTAAFTSGRRGFRVELSTETRSDRKKSMRVGLPAVTVATLTSTTTTTSLPGATLWSCSFEDADNSLCGMEQSTEDDFDWTRHSGETPSDPTGPSAALVGQYYIYIECSKPRKALDQASLFFPDLNLDGEYCVKFAYHMFGHHINSLKLIRVSNGSPSLAWNMTVEKGNKWLRADVDVTMLPEDKLVIEGKRGMEYSGDIAFDDVSIVTGQCSA